MDKLNWQTASEDQIIRALIEHVLKLPIALLKGQDCAYLAYNEHAPENKEFWRIIVNGYDRVFNPLHDMNDAWMIIEAMALLWACSRQEACDEICKASLRTLGLLEEDDKEQTAADN